MATEAQVEANRANAQKSTGPRTPEGKATVAQNAIKHGLFARETVIRGEDEDQFEMFRLLLLKQLTPDSPLEEVLGERVVDLSWRLKRASRDQSEAFAALYEKYAAAQVGEPGDAALLSGNTKEANQDRAPKRDTSRLGTQIGGPGPGSGSGAGIPSASLSGQALPVDSDHGQARPEPCERDAHATDTAAAPPGMIGRMILEDFSQNGVLERLLRYERRIENSLLRTLKEMRGIFDQRQKAAQEVKDTLARWKEEDWEAKKKRMFGPRPPAVVSPGSAGGATNIPKEGVSSVKCQVLSQAGPASDSGSLPTSNSTLQTPGGTPIAQSETCKTNPILEGASRVECQISGSEGQTCKTKPICAEAEEGRVS